MTYTSVVSNGSPGKAMSSGNALRNAGGNPEGRATLMAAGGTGQSETAACAGTAIANAPVMAQIHFTALSFPR